MEEIVKKNQEFERTMEDVAVKMQDFNIYDLFKNSGGEGGNADVSAVLVQNLEKKVFKKFEFIDEKAKKSDEENYKLKGEIGNIKNNCENINKNINNYIQDNDVVFNDINITLEENREKFDEIEVNMDKLFKKIMKDIETKEKHFADIQNNMTKNDGESSNNDKNMEDKSRMSGNNFSEIEMKMIRDCAKKVNDLEKNLKILVNNINIDSIKNDISKLQEGIGQKANSNDLYDMKDNICKKLFKIIYLFSFSPIFDTGNFHQG